MDTSTLPPHAAEKARGAAILGTRALVADETLTAVLALLIGSGVVTSERAGSMLTELSMRIRGHADGHQEWRVHPAELELQARRVSAMAEGLGGAS